MIYIQNALPPESQSTIRRNQCIKHVAYACFALNLGLVLLITYKRPLRRTTLQSRCRLFADLSDDRTFIVYTLFSNQLIRTIYQWL